MSKFEEKYFTRLNHEFFAGDNFEITSNQNYLYSKKILQPWHKFAKVFLLKTYNKVLEIGCGNGALLETIKANYRAGIELDVRAANQINAEIVDVQIISLEKYAADSSKECVFDAIFAFEVIEHFSDPVEFVLSCSKLLKKGGYLIGSTPNALRWWLDMAPREEFDRPPNHFVSFSQIQLHRLMIDHGFKVIYLDSAFTHQNWRHVFYRTSMFTNKVLGRNFLSRFIGYSIAIGVSPLFSLMNLMPGKYLHHGFIVEKTN